MNKVKKLYNILIEKDIGHTSPNNCEYKIRQIRERDELIEKLYPLKVIAFLIYVISIIYLFFNLDN
tara:strand:- start:31 stop:228 length:198 start_codon:yes stop_codon:yes gene_type:complete